MDYSRIVGTALLAKLQSLVAAGLWVQHLGHAALRRAGGRRCLGYARRSELRRGRANARRTDRRHVSGAEANSPQFPVNASADALGGCLASASERDCDDGSAHHDSYMSSSLVNHTSDESPEPVSKTLPRPAAVGRGAPKRGAGIGGTWSRGPLAGCDRGADQDASLRMPIHARHRGSDPRGSLFRPSTRPGFRGCDREGARRNADLCGAASRSGGPVERGAGAPLAGMRPWNRP
jgi:hypothetical protein